MDETCRILLRTLRITEMDHWESWGLIANSSLLGGSHTPIASALPAVVCGAPWPFLLRHPGQFKLFIRLTSSGLCIGLQLPNVMRDLVSAFVM